MTKILLEVEEFVSVLYRAILRRDPDEIGLKVHTHNLSMNFTTRSLEILIQEFISSPEFQSLHNPHDSCSVELCEKIYPVSLGSHCYTSALLKKLNLKTQSMPFDWIFSNLGMVNHCIKDDFYHFLDRQHYVSTEIDERDHMSANLCEHMYYKKEFGVRFVFNHRDPNKSSDYEYYVRCVERFREYLFQPGFAPVFFITFRYSEDQVLEFNKIVQTLRTKRSNCKIIGLAIASSCGQRPTEDVLISREGVYLSKINPSSDWIDVRFRDPVDDLFVIGRLTAAIHQTKN